MTAKHGIAAVCGKCAQAMDGCQTVGMMLLQSLSLRKPQKQPIK